MFSISEHRGVLKMKQRNSSRHFIKDSIVKALIDLMKVKDYDKITITEITGKAGVSRMAYYRYYSSKDNILDQHIAEITASVHEKAIKSEGDEKMRIYLREMFKILGKHKDMSTSVINANIGVVLLRNIRKSMFAAFGKENMTSRQKYELDLIVGGFCNLFIQWLKNDCEETPDEMADICCDMLSYSGFINALKD